MLLRNEAAADFRDRITREAPGFTSSSQYELLDEEDRTVPGLVFAAFASFLHSLQERVTSGNEKQSIGDLERSLQILEAAAGSDDSVKNLVVTEVFENWHGGAATDLLRNRLGPEGDALYRRWIEKTSN